MRIGASLSADNFQFLIPLSCPCRLAAQFRHTHKIIGSPDKPPGQLGSHHPFVVSTSKASNRFHPPENLFYSLSSPLAQLIPYMTRRPSINRRTSATLPILRY